MQKLLNSIFGEVNPKWHLSRTMTLKCAHNQLNSLCYEQFGWTSVKFNYAILKSTFVLWRCSIVSTWMRLEQTTIRSINITNRLFECIVGIKCIEKEHWKIPEIKCITAEASLQHQTIGFAHNCKNTVLLKYIEKCDYLIWNRNIPCQNRWQLSGCKTFFFVVIFV